MSQRMRRVNAILKEAIAEEVADLKDPRLGFVTVTGVDTAPNLRHATVFYSVIGDEETKKKTEQGLKSALPFVRREIARRLSLKTAPDLRFRYDDTLDRAERMDQLLDEVSSELHSEDD